MEGKDKGGKAAFLPSGITLPQGVTPEYLFREVLLGVTVCFAQIPESVAFAFMAHIKPPIALHAAWVIGFTVSAFGGRPGMVNGATGAFAAIIGTFIETAGTGNNGEGVELLFPSVMLAGVFMILVSWLKLSRFITMLPAPVMIGFCNGLAIVIGLAQLHPFKDSETHEWKEGAELIWMLVICFTSMSVMEFLPQVPLKLFKVVPSSLMAIISAVILEFLVVRVIAGSRTNTIKDLSEFTPDTAFPIPFFIKTKAVSYELDNILEGDGIMKIIIQGFLLCTVGTIESLMTSEVVESFVKTPSNHNRTVLAMGVGNIISGFLGGMGGNAMIGLSTVNCLNGGKGRLGPIVAALGIAICCMGAYPLLNFIPVAALAGVMIVVVLHTFKWFSLTMLVAALLPKKYRAKWQLHRKVPRCEVFVIVIVTVLANATNIAYAVGAGVAICSMAFAWQAGRQLDVVVSEEDDKKQYHIDGPLFFVTANKFKRMLDPDNDPDTVEVWLGGKLMDYTAMGIIHELSMAYANKGKTLKFHKVDPESEQLLVKAGHLVKEVSYELDTGILDDVNVPTIKTEFSKDPGHMMRQLSPGSKDQHEDAGWDEAAAQTSSTVATLFRRSLSWGKKDKTDSGVGSHVLEEGGHSGYHHDSMVGTDTPQHEHDGAHVDEHGVRKPSVHSIGGVVLEGLSGPGQPVTDLVSHQKEGHGSPETHTPPTSETLDCAASDEKQLETSHDTGGASAPSQQPRVLPDLFGCFPAQEPRQPRQDRQCFAGLRNPSGELRQQRSCLAGVTPRGRAPLPQVIPERLHSEPQGEAVGRPEDVVD